MVGLLKGLEQPRLFFLRVHFWVLWVCPALSWRVFVRVSVVWGIWSLDTKGAGKRAPGVYGLSIRSGGLVALCTGEQNYHRSQSTSYGAR